MEYPKNTLSYDINEAVKAFDNLCKSIKDELFKLIEKILWMLT